ncbi:hypothetical protein RND81_07G139200 [Saponaria officinalis]|uniref:Reverse transcriptase n=1 Tax=Saponaria officinalis TaxID=3572 RepID=A0AAW1JSM1_SAPOF
MRRRCRVFNSWIENNHMLELNFSGPPHTWSRGCTPETRKWARLDRALCNQGWRELYEEASVRHLIQNHSDHCPLLVNTNGFAPINRITRPFRFQAAWMNHAKFSEFVTSNWNKLRRQIEDIQRNPSYNYSYSLMKWENKLRRELDNVLQQEELLWFQKSRMEQICDGDRNTKFVHLSTIIRRKRNRIERLQNENDVWLWDPSEIKSHVMSYYKTLFTASNYGSLEKMLIGAFPVLEDEEKGKLDSAFTDSEIQGALSQMSPYKAPGPNGFQALFYQTQWSVFSPSVNKFILYLLRGRDFPNDFNDTFVSLIPKVENPNKITQFRPIGLCNVSYKILSKVLVNRLKKNSSSGLLALSK